MSWQTMTLGEVVTLKRGHDLPERDRREGPVPIVSSSGVTGFHIVAKAEPPGVVTGRYGTLGEVYFIDEPYWPLNTSLYAIDFHENDPKFVSYFLRQALKGASSNSKAAVPGVNRNDLHALKVKVPDRDVQERIAGTLSAYDDLIENNRRRIKLLEESARLIYREWFVRLRFPGHEQIKIESGIPDGWTIGPLHSIAAILSGYAFKSSTFLEGGEYGLVTIKNVQDGAFNSECSSYVSDLPRAMPSHCILGQGDILLSLTGNIGRVCRVLEGKYLLNQRVAKIEPMDASFNSFIYLLTREPAFRQKLESMSGGSAQQNLSPNSVKNSMVLIPDVELARDFARICDPIFAQIDVLLSQSRKLGIARDLLLPRLMSGEIEV